MIKRTCPACGTVNYSADSLRDWSCCQCGERIKRTAGIVRPAPSQIKKVEFDGPCPFLTCLKTGPHSHSVCPECGAVRHGKPSCPECRKHTGKIERD